MLVIRSEHAHGLPAASVTSHVLSLACVLSTVRHTDAVLAVENASATSHQLSPAMSDGMACHLPSIAAQHGKGRKEGMKASAGCSVKRRQAPASYGHIV